MPATHFISLVDDDASVCKSLTRLFKSVGYAVQTYSSAEDFLQAGAADKTDCLVLDVHMGGASGLQLQGKLHCADKRFPIVFITGQTDYEQIRNQALSNGAHDFLRKQVDGERLLDVIAEALRDL